MAIAPMARATDPGWLAILVENLMNVPDADGVSASTLARAWRDARDRLRVLGDVEMVALAGHPRCADLEEWVADGRLIAVAHQGITLVPTFQLDSADQPHPAVADVIATLACDPWTAALWFSNRTAHLGDRRPMDVIGGDPERVVASAQQDAHAIGRSPGTMP